MNENIPNNLHQPKCIYCCIPCISCFIFVEQIMKYCFLGCLYMFSLPGSFKNWLCKKNLKISNEFDEI